MPKVGHPVILRITATYASERAWGFLEYLQPYKKAHVSAS